MVSGSVAVTANTNGGGVAFVAHVAGFVLGAAAVNVFKKRQAPVEWLY